MKRELTGTPAVPPPSAARAVQAAIALASTSDLPPQLYTRLLASLTDAHRLAVEQEEENEEHVRKRVKVEEKEEVAVEKRDFAVQTDEEEELPPPLLPYPYASVQGELTELERMVLRDIEAGQPLLDKLGILLRPLKNDEGKIDLTVWEAAFSMPTDSNWARSLPKARVIFDAGYLQLAPRLKLPANFFHPNVYPSGTIASRCSSHHLLERTWGESLRKTLDELGLPFLRLESGKKGRGSETDTHYAQLPPVLRLPFALEAAKLVIAYENFENPSQLEAYQMGKREPDQYRAEVRRLVLTLLPSPSDIEDLIKAQRRAEWRKKTGQEPTLQACIANL